MNKERIKDRLGSIETILQVIEGGIDQGDIPGGSYKWFLVSDKTIARMRKHLADILEECQE